MPGHNRGKFAVAAAQSACIIYQSFWAQLWWDKL